MLPTSKQDPCNAEDSGIDFDKLGRDVSGSDLRAIRDQLTPSSLPQGEYVGVAEVDVGDQDVGGMIRVHSAQSPVLDVAISLRRFPGLRSIRTGDRVRVVVDRFGAVSKAELAP